MDRAARKVGARRVLNPWKMQRADARHAGLEALKLELLGLKNGELVRGESRLTRALVDRAWLLWRWLVRFPLLGRVFGMVLIPLRRAVSALRTPGTEEVLHGTAWPPQGYTMIGLARLSNVEQCVRDVLGRGVPGDLLEAGTWRGGVVMFMRALLEAYGDRERRVWGADSFRGLPPPNPTVAQYKGDMLWAYPELAVSASEVRANLARFGLFDDRVRLLEGWFKDTLPTAPIERLAVMHLDGDLYESQMDALQALYPKLSVGGYVIIDDYFLYPNCRAAIDDYRAQRGVKEPLQAVDSNTAFWRKERPLVEG
jgi:O-methyltransferase